MANKQSKKRSGFLRALWAVLVLALVMTGCGAPEQQGSASSEQPGSVQETAVSFPYLLEDGKLEISSLFQYSGMNPDCGDEMGENIASIAVTNQSDQHLTRAEFTVTRSDGEVLSFLAEDVPAGQTVWAFDRNNAACELEDTYEAIDCQASFEPDSPLLTDRLTVAVEETAVTLTNISGEALNDLTVHCHCLFDGVYFGGKTYAYPADSIPAGGSADIQAEDCYLGEAAVVRIDSGR